MNYIITTQSAKLAFVAAVALSALAALDRAVTAIVTTAAQALF